MNNIDMKKELKLYVWENVLTDYTSGVMFALANSVDQAKELIIKKMGYESEDLEKDPRVINDVEGFFCYGGM